MLTIEQRRDLLDRIGWDLKEKNYPYKDPSETQSFTPSEKYYSTIELPLCSAGFVHSQGYTPRVSITTLFGIPYSEKMIELIGSYDGSRIIYEGSFPGIEVISIEGINFPDKSGNDPNEKRRNHYGHNSSLQILKGKLEGREKITEEDTARFDAFLKYIQKRL